MAEKKTVNYFMFTDGVEALPPLMKDDLDQLRNLAINWCFELARSQNVNGQLAAKAQYVLPQWASFSIEALIEEKRRPYTDLCDADYEGELPDGAVCALCGHSFDASKLVYISLGVSKKREITINVSYMLHLLIDHNVSLPGELAAMVFRHSYDNIAKVIPVEQWSREDLLDEVHSLRGRLSTMQENHDALSDSHTALEARFAALRQQVEDLMNEAPSERSNHDEEGEEDDGDDDADSYEVEEDEDTDEDDDGINIDEPDTEASGEAE